MLYSSKNEQTIATSNNWMKLTQILSERSQTIGIHIPVVRNTELGEVTGKACGVGGLLLGCW